MIVENSVGTEDKRENKELLQFFNGIYHERDVCADDNEQKQQGNENDDGQSKNEACEVRSYKSRHQI